MQKITPFLVLLITPFYLAQVNWMSLEQAMEAQKTNPKKIVIDFYADWCIPCKVMDKNTYNHPIISEFLNNKYYPVKFNAEEKSQVTVFGRTFSNPNASQKKGKNALHEFTQYMNVNAVPSAVFLDETGAPITILQGELSAKELEPYLSLIAEDEYKKITTRDEWESYQKKFKSKIKN